MPAFPKSVVEQFLRSHDPIRYGSPNEVGQRPTVSRQAVPSLPPRQNNLTRHRIHRYNSFLNGGYGDYGSYGYPPYSSSLYRQQDFENRYIQMAEESAQPAFESIEAFIRGFSSVTMMLESTYQAMTMSFRAILGVAENMTRMRSAVIEFLSAFAILKMIYSFYRRILYFLGLVNDKEISWRESGEVVKQGKASKRHWPILAFLGAIIIGPTLVYKYLLPTEIEYDDEVQLVGIYHFDAENNGEISFVKGDLMTTKESELKKSWIRVTKSNKEGLVPYNRVRVVPKSINVLKKKEVQSDVRNFHQEPEEDISAKDVKTAETSIPKKPCIIVKKSNLTSVPHNRLSVNPTITELPNSEEQQTE